MLKIWEVVREEINAGRMKATTAAEAKFAGGVQYRTTATVKAFCPDFRERADVFYLPQEGEYEYEVDRDGIEFSDADTVFAVFTKDGSESTPVYTMLVHTEDQWLLMKKCECTKFFKEVLLEDGFKTKKFVKG